MRLLLDANISIRLVAPLEQMGHDVVSMITIDPRTPDAAVLEKAFREKRVVITYDHDFGELVFKEGNPHFGVILLRLRDESYVSQLSVLRHFLENHNEQKIQQYFWVLTEAGVRRATKLTPAGEVIISTWETE
ncbi:DUF5615 family PIN-like protein [Candidatus Uhrbacteria bacterium]|nr:DUF5615 family PIN-like protein [Candidatus Uhrbacteria bacterium]